MREINREQIRNITDELLEVLSGKQVSLADAKTIADVFTREVEKNNEISVKRYMETGVFQKESKNSNGLVHLP